MGSEQPQEPACPAAAAATKGLLSFGSLARQNSIYALTLDEFQNCVPDMKHFGSMNMDEFLKNIWTAEEQQAMQALMEGGPDGGGGAGDPDQGAGGPPVGAGGGLLQRQPSLTLPDILSRKTVDEVWQEIHGGGSAAAAAAAAAMGTSSSGEHHQRTNTLGEMTLEDFLLRAGVHRNDMVEGGGFPGAAAAGDRDAAGGAGAGAGAAEHPALSLLPSTAVVDPMQLDAIKQQQQQVQQQAQAQWLNDQYRTVAHHQQQQQAEVAAAHAYVSAAKRLGTGALAAGLGPLAAGLGGPLGADGYGGGLGIGLGAAAGLSTLALGPGSPSGGGGGLSDGVVPGGNGGLALSPIGGAGFGFDPLRSRKRASDGPVERVVERRQRRMIKNRESAARSRARKQVRCVRACVCVQRE